MVALTAAREQCCGLLSTVTRLVIAALLVLSCNAQLTWTLMPIAPGSLVPPVRGVPALGWFPAQQQLVMFGGQSSQALGDTWIYTEATQTWEQVVTAPSPSPRFGMAFGAYTAVPGQEALIVAHGTRSGSETNNEVWSFSLATRTWNQLPNQGEVPPGRYGCFSALYPGASQLIMGFGFSTHRYSDVAVYDLGSNTWSQLVSHTSAYNPSEPHARCLVAAAQVAPTRLVVYGGCMQGGFTGGTCPSRDGWVLDWSASPAAAPHAGPAVHSPAWRALPLGPSPRNYPAMSRVPLSWGLGAQWAVLLGGQETSKQTLHVTPDPVGVVQLVDTAERTWWHVDSMAALANPYNTPGFRSGTSLAADDVGGRVLMYGGNTRGGTGANTTGYIWALTYSPPPATGTPARVAVAVTPLTNPAPWFLYPHLHGMFMGVSWGLLLPGGVLIARHMRHRDPLWFQLHRAMQVSGVVLSLVGLAVVLVGGASNPLFAHGMIGLLVLLLGVSQPVNALLRPHHGAKWRRAWEVGHRVTGGLAVLLGLTNVTLGVFLVVAPKGVWITWCVVLGLWVLGGGALEVRLWRRKGRAGVSGDGDRGSQEPLRKGMTELRVVPVAATADDPVVAGRA